MTTADKQFSLFENKSVDQVDAIKEGRGRPKAGLDMYCTQTLKPKFLSKCDQHIAMKIANVLIVGIYFNPEIEFDDITEKLTSILENDEINDDTAIIIGGDFNVKPHEIEFKELSNFFDSYGLQVTSDISKPTFEKNGSKSTLDYIFTNSKTSVINAKTVNYLNSDHYALTIKIRIPPIIHITKDTIKCEKKTKLNYEECRDDLKDISVDVYEIDDIILKLNDILKPENNKNRKVIKKRKKYNLWYTEDLRNMRKKVFGVYQKWQRSKFEDENLHNEYSKLKRDYHSSIKVAKATFKLQELEEKLEDINENGMSEAYKFFKDNKTSSTIDTDTFREFYHDLLNKKDSPNRIPTQTLVECSQCEYYTRDSSRMVSHVEVVHEKFKDFWCTKCDKEAIDLTELEKHMKSVHKKRKISKCDTCNFTDHTKTGMKKHFKDVHMIESGSDIHPLLKEITEENVLSALSHMSSKAKSSHDLSPHDLKQMKKEICAPLTRIFNNVLSHGLFPDMWLETAMFFLHKKGDKEDPNNYRSICIQNPILKCFCHILAERLCEYAEAQKLIPNLQFAYRKKRSTIGAATLLKNAINSRLNREGKKSLRTYAAYIDFRKCFDSVNRGKLFEKLMDKNIPQHFCSIIDYIYRNTRYFIRSGSYLAEPFTTSTGVPQGCKISSILFSLYVADLPNALHKKGVTMGRTVLNYLQYSDDLVILARTAIELQHHLDKIVSHCNTIELVINTDKTKVQIFYKGRLPNADTNFKFTVNNEELECVNEFKYLGIIFTTQLSFTKHIEMINTKARSKIGLILGKLKSMNIELDMILKMFECYVLPSYTYGLNVWFDNISQEAKKTLNSTFTKYLKRYLGLPYNTLNSLVYHVTETHPLNITLHQKFHQSKQQIETQINDAQIQGVFEGNQNIHDMHIKIVHDKEKNFNCTKCEYTTKFATELKTHIDTVHQHQNEFKCTKCNFTDDKRRHLNYHIKEVHTKRKSINLDCDECNSNTCWLSHNFSKIPSYFWFSKTFIKLPTKLENRRKLCRNIFDLEHYDLCTNKQFHLPQNIDEKCVCVECNDQMENYHGQCYPFRVYPEISFFN